MSSKSKVLKPNQIPDDILNNEVLNQIISRLLPDNYNFEIHKTLWRIRRDDCKRVCLQFPDGLFIFAVPIVDILSEFSPGVQFITMADVVYGACCIDDVKAQELGCDLIVHYGHSCLVPINRMANGVSVLYVFVDIKFDLLHFINTVLTNFNPVEHKICLASTIQFISSTHLAAQELREKHSFEVFLPQSRPLTPGEILGCTAPKLNADQANIIVFIADGRFHLEALMIANPSLPAYRYCPYGKTMTHEYYEYNEMIEQRKKSVLKGQQVIESNEPIGIIVGTLGRQGSVRILDSLKRLIKSKSNSQVLTFLISEINPKMLKELSGGQIKCWIQIGCPRLSIDWGDACSYPLLTPYELRTAIKNIQNDSNEEYNKFNFVKNNSSYPMDFYANSSLGNWTPNHKCHNQCQCDNLKSNQT